MDDDDLIVLESIFCIGFAAAVVAGVILGVRAII